jgi:hypothetical protein
MRLKCCMSVLVSASSYLSHWLLNFLLPVWEYTKISLLCCTTDVYWSGMWSQVLFCLLVYVPDNQNNGWGYGPGKTSMSINGHKNVSGTYKTWLKALSHFCSWTSFMYRSKYPQVSHGVDYLMNYFCYLESCILFNDSSCLVMFFYVL